MNPDSIRLIIVYSPCDKALATCIGQMRYNIDFVVEVTRLNMAIWLKNGRHLFYKIGEI